MLILIDNSMLRVVFDEEASDHDLPAPVAAPAPTSQWIIRPGTDTAIPAVAIVPDNAIPS